INKLLGNHPESMRVWMQLIGPIGRVERALSLDKDEIIGRSCKRSQQVLKIEERLVDNRRALYKIVATKIERRLEPWPCTYGVRSIGDRKIIAMTEDWNIRSKPVAKCKEVAVGCFDHAERFLEPSGV